MMGFELSALLRTTAYSLRAARDLLVVVHPRADELFHFFIAPLVVEGTVALLLGFAYAASRKSA